MADKKRILIVEDEKPMGHALELKLESEGFEVSTASNGVEALEVLEKETFNLVLLDLVMPKKDGFEVLTELKEKKNTTPVIVSSNLGQEEDFKKAEELGAVDYLIKSDSTLSQIIEKVKATIK
ncbi:MAG: response regulator [Candidatus Jacksonbacteria bacterium]|jgi:DNA-binding response OmpR family regulator|nr:response regulator [Candidatus Jacksonbacteria bacterium]MBT6034067.1 response regulator [Candidatus Jacksonbacteria bacterium]MBT6301000.1 response regulator [Candidatus Jacksonbacteria bacterium]